MTLEIIRDTLGWCTIINSGFLAIWILMMTLGRTFMFRMHGRLFPMSEERFNAIHYAGLAFLKTLIIVFNLTPYLALRIVGE
jgi:hypothetical protein